MHERRLNFPRVGDQVPQGYRDVRVTRRNGPVVRVDPELIEDQLTYRSGEPFDSRKLAGSRAAIVGLNLFNAVEFGLPDSNISSGTFGTIQRLAGDPRVMQFALRFVF